MTYSDLLPTSGPRLISSMYWAIRRSSQLTILDVPNFALKFLLGSPDLVLPSCAEGIVYNFPAKQMCVNQLEDHFSGPQNIYLYYINIKTWNNEKQFCFLLQTKTELMQGFVVQHLHEAAGISFASPLYLWLLLVHNDVSS